MLDWMNEWIPLMDGDPDEFQSIFLPHNKVYLLQ